MVAVITGDIVDSRSVRTEAWIDPLKRVLSAYGESPKEWELFRGDSFQLLLKNPEDSLLAAMRTKACIKSSPGQDVRMAIGVGDIDYRAARITESNGDAFVRSGDAFDALEKIRTTLALREWHVRLLRWTKLPQGSVNGDWTRGVRAPPRQRGGGG